MAYVPTHPKPFQSVSFPKTVAGYRRRFEAETKEIERTTHKKRRVVLKVYRSFTFMQAERLGEARFRQLCRELGLSMRSRKLTWHRVIAENAVKLLWAADRLPDDDAVLARYASNATD